MQREILRIAGHTVDIIPNTINRNLQINDLGSAEDRQSNYSNTVKLPLTSNNKLIFNFLGVPGNTSRSPYKQLPCSYSVDGIPLIINGYAEIKSTEIKSTGAHYEVVLYDGVIDLAEKLKGKTLSDLNFSDLNHYLSVENYHNSFTNTSGYIYALGDFGFGARKIERTVPSIYTHTLWDKIFKEAGVNYQGPFFTGNNDFLTEVITPPLGYEVQNVSPTITAIGTYDTDLIAHFEQSDDYILDANKRMGFQTTFASGDITFGTNGELTFNSTGRYRINLDISYNSNNGYNQFQVILNDRTAKVENLISGGSSLSLELNLSVNAGDVVYFMIHGSDTGYHDTGTEGTPENKYMVDYSVSASVSFSEVTGGYLVEFNQMMGTMTQLDFIKDILYRYGLILKPIRGTRDYEFIQFENLLNDRAGVENWSDKLVSIDKESYTTSYAKENKAKYNYAEEIKVPTHDGILSINNENAEADKAFFSSPYEIPVTNRSLMGNPLYYHPTWEEKEEDGVTVVKVKESKIKTFRILREAGTIYTYYFNDATSTSYTGDIPFLSLENMSLQYFLNVYYKAYRLTIEHFKEVDMTLNLNEIDIYDLDFFKLKYFRQSGKYYYCNKIQHKAGGKVSSGVFVELNGFSSNAPVQTLGSYTYNMSYQDSRVLSFNYLTTYSDPVYYDPENDAPYKVKFLDGNGTQVKMYQAGVEITAGQEILVSDWDVTVIDMGTTTSAHQVSWNYQIMDEGSNSYGDAVGTFTASVYQFTNSSPVANAGNDQTVLIPIDAYHSVAQLNGSNSYDPNGDSLTYLWTIVSKPGISTATLFSTTNANGGLTIPNKSSSVGSYYLRLKVTDSHGAFTTDTVYVTVQEGSGSGPGGFENA